MAALLLAAIHSTPNWARCEAHPRGPTRSNAAVNEQNGEWFTRQATGPPRSGAGVGVGMLRGAGESVICEQKLFENVLIYFRFYVLFVLFVLCIVCCLCVASHFHFSFFLFLLFISIFRICKSAGTRVFQQCQQINPAFGNNLNPPKPHNVH